MANDNGGAGVMTSEPNTRRVVAVALALAACAAMVVAILAYYQRGNRLTTLQGRADALAHVTARDIGGGLGPLIGLLTQAAHHVPRTGPVPNDVLEPLRGQLAERPGLRALSWIDADGILRQVLHRSLPRQAPPLDLSDRPHIQGQIRNPTANALQVAPPMPSPLIERRAWYLSRPVLAADGHLIGILSMALDPETLSEPLQTAIAGLDGSAGVFSADGFAFGLVPDGGQVIGHSIASTPMFLAYGQRAPARQGGRPASVSPLTGLTKQLVGFATIPGTPLVVHVGLSREPVLRQWRRETAGQVLALLLALAGLAAALSLRGSVRRATAIAQEADERFRLFGDISPIPLVLTSAVDNRVIYINNRAGQAFGVPAAEAPGKNATDFWADCGERTAMTTKLLADGQLLGMEAQLKRADGVAFTALLSAALGHLAGEPVVLVTVQDITPRKRLELELARSNAELEQFSYAVSHDLQEPLRMVASYLRLLERRIDDKLDDETRDFIGFAVDGSVRMSRMINDLLDYSRVHAQQWTLESADLNTLLAEALSNLAPLATESEGVIRSDTLPELEVETGQIMRVLQNLIGNALKYRAPDRKPQIDISCRRDGNEWVFTVKDNGLGFDPGGLDRLFLPFQRLHGPKIAGTGVGLALCRRIIHGHGGRIWAESAGPGQGAAFTFTLPALCTHEPTVSA